MRNPPGQTLPLRIAFVDHCPVRGGAQIALLRILSRIDRHIVDPVFFLPSQASIRQDLQRLGIRCVPIALPPIRKGFPGSLSALLAAAGQLRRSLRREGIDGVHANTVRAQMLSAIGSPVPAFWWLHDDTFPRTLFRFLRRRSAWIAANSRFIADRYGLLRLPGTSVLPNGLEEDPAAGDRQSFRRAFGIPEDALVVAAAGRLVRMKGQDLFLEAAARVADRMPGIYFLVIGEASAEDEGPGPHSGGTAYRRHLECLSVGIAGKGRVIFCGHLHPMADAYAGMDLLVHYPSRPEAFGLVLIEAMRAGVPVIAAQEGGPLEIVEPESSGRLVPPRDPARLAEEIRSLLNDPARRAEFARKGPRVVRRKFRLEDQVRRLEEIYLRVFGSGRPGSAADRA